MKGTVRTAVILFSLALALIGVKAILTLTRHPSDQVLIEQAITDSLDASRKGQPGGVLDLLSKKLTVNQQSVGDSSQIAQFVKNSRPDITLENHRALVTGDEAKIVSPVDLKLAIGPSIHLDDVTLIFHKEEGRGFLFIPTANWRLTEVRLPDSQMPNISE